MSAWQERSYKCNRAITLWNALLQKKKKVGSEGSGEDGGGEEGRRCGGRDEWLGWWKRGRFVEEGQVRESKKREMVKKGVEEGVFKEGEITEGEEMEEKKAM